MLYLHVETAVGGSEVLATLEGETLYGSPEVPGSLLVLAPGRTRAVFSSHTNDFARSPSTNTIPVRVLPRPPG